MSDAAGLRIVLADDEEVVRRIIGDYLLDNGHQVQNVSNGQETIGCLAKEPFDLALIDLKMPKMDGLSLLKKIQANLPLLPVVIMTGHGSMEVAIEALRNGAADFLVKPIKLFELDAVLEKALQLGRLRQNNLTLRQTLSTIQAQGHGGPDTSKMVGASPAMTDLRAQIRELVDSGCTTVLITGETGCGKEVAARQIHQASAQPGPFLAVSCPSLPESILESELFGYQKGTFTGAQADKAGYFEMAANGTLFLDEISEISPAAQASLLRVLEERSFRRLGNSREIKVRARIVAASNANLDQMMQEGAFRSDLYYRLAVYPLHIPALRHRTQDILPLAEHFLDQYNFKRKKPGSIFSVEAKEQLLAYEYPGNARELSNIVERAAILAKGKQILPEHLFVSDPNKSRVKTEKSPPVESRERDRILRALEASKWNRKQAARSLGIPYSTLRYKINKLGIS
ncbi:MAG: sigma-54 dependent transcriptional regulator [Desulfohalobiaceae bacterium]|nr:sigma-54 dependent transcriptional regulator [Desulfohalobiaceae bacterium]